MVMGYTEFCHWKGCQNKRLMLPEGYKADHCAEHYEQLRVMHAGRVKADKARANRRLEWRYARDMATYQARMSTWQPIATVLDEYLSSCNDRFRYPRIKVARELFDQYKPREPEKPGDEGD